MVSIGHIAMSLSEIFNFFYSSLRLLMLYTKHLYSLQGTNIFSWKFHGMWIFFLSSSQLQNSSYTGLQLVQKASLQRLLEAQELHLIFYEQADSLLVVCCLCFVFSGSKCRKNSLSFLDSQSQVWWCSVNMIIMPIVN